MVKKRQKFFKNFDDHCSVCHLTNGEQNAPVRFRITTLPTNLRPKYKRDFFQAGSVSDSSLPKSLTSLSNQKHYMNGQIDDGNLKVSMLTPSSRKVRNNRFNYHL